VKRVDLLLVACAVALTIASGVFAAGGRGGEPTLIVESPQGKWVYRMGTAREVGIPGSLGVSRIRIAEGGAVFVESPCTNKLCVAHGPLRRAGEWNACLPNRVMVRVEGDAGGLDAVAF
jgi:hypothetical protein